MMLAAQILAPGRAHVIETDQPTPAPDEVLIEVAAAGICGTDIHIFRGEYMATYPLIPGHEFSGTGLPSEIASRVSRLVIASRLIRTSRVTVVPLASATSQTSAKISRQSASHAVE